LQIDRSIAASQRPHNHHPNLRHSQPPPLQPPPQPPPLPTTTQPPPHTPPHTPTPRPPNTPTPQHPDAPTNPTKHRYLHTWRARWHRRRTRAASPPTCPSPTACWIGGAATCTTPTTARCGSAGDGCGVCVCVCVCVRVCVFDCVFDCVGTGGAAGARLLGGAALLNREWAGGLSWVLPLAFDSPAVSLSCPSCSQLSASATVNRVSLLPLPLLFLPPLFLPPCFCRCGKGIRVRCEG